MEFIFNIAIGIILCGFLFFSTTISDMTVEADLFGSGGFPILFSVIGLFLLLLSTLQTMKAKKTSADADKKEDDSCLGNIYFFDDKSRFSHNDVSVYRYLCDCSRLS